MPSGAQAEHGIDTRLRPAHAGQPAAGLDDPSVNALYGAGADEHFVLAVPRVAHAIAVRPEVLEALAHNLGGSAAKVGELGEALDDVGGLTLRHVVEERLHPCGTASTVLRCLAAFERSRLR